MTSLLNAEYEAAATGVGLHDRSYRGLIEITGRDRASWFHNLFTNEVKNLPEGQGSYGFALTIKGRVVFDGNVLPQDERLLLDLDGRWVSGALTHLNKYIIMEDVGLADRSGAFERLSLVGPKAVEILAPLGVHDAAAMPQLQQQWFRIGQVDTLVVRHDFAGSFAVEMLIAADGKPAVQDAITTIAEPMGLIAVGSEALQVLRVEAGIPWSCEDIDEAVLPVETGQIERAVSFNKGCYLGQEVVERMRAHHAVARQLVGLVFDEAAAQPGAKLLSEGQPVGRVTSVVHSIKMKGRIGLGYLKSSLTNEGTQLMFESEADSGPCRVHKLPFC